MKKIINVVLALLIVLSLASCSNKQEQSLIEKLSTLDDISSIEVVKENQSKWLSEKYIIMVEQQIDWNDPE